MEKTLVMSLLFDFYGPLLTQRQQDIYQMYYHEDLSLGEISAQLGVSRQAIYDILKRSSASLEDFESKLRLVEKYQTEQELLRNIEDRIEALSDALSNDISSEAYNKLCAVRRDVQRLLVES